MLASAAPVKTLGKAAALVNAGGTVRVGAGTYQLTKPLELGFSDSGVRW
eukprot:SAG31_NODE_30309_length_383_cov_0.549296_1_plen_48_part_01